LVCDSDIGQTVRRLHGTCKGGSNDFCRGMKTDCFTTRC
jgi:hypothetical protein